MTSKRRDLEKTKPAQSEAAPLLLDDLRRTIERPGKASLLRSTPP